MNRLERVKAMQDPAFANAMAIQRLIEELSMVEGKQGEIGPQGIQGIPGEKGDRGDQGDAGEKGDAGEQGLQGIRGERGPQGEKGDSVKGEKGDQGEKGKDAVLPRLDELVAQVRAQLEPEPFAKQKDLSDLIAFLKLGGFRGGGGSGGGSVSPLTTKGDLYTFSTQNARLGVGTDGFALVADSTQTTGLKWASVTGTGTVTTLSVATANGLAGTVATATTTPVITLSTTVTGIVKGNGTALSAAVAGTDYENPLTFSGPLVRNTNTISIPAATGSVDGYLSAANFNTFNGKQNTITLTTTGTGAATLVGATLNIPTPTGTGTVTSVTSADGNATVATTTTTPVITIVSAPKWANARTLAGNSVDGSANVAFVNKFIVQGTTDTGLSGAQFLGALATGIVKNTTTTGVLSIATAGTDYEVPLTFSTGLTRTTNTITVNTSQNIATLSNLTTNGFVKTTGGTGALSIDTSTYLTANQTITLTGWAAGSGTTAISTTTASKVILQGTTDATTTNAQFLGALATGLVKNTTTTGVLSIATAGTDYQAPITLTTTGTSGAATFIGNTLNIPNYATSGGSPLTTKGDLFGFDTAGNRIPVGSNTFVLTADSTQALGVKWAAPVTGFTNPMTTLGDIIYEDATPTAVRLAGNTTTTKKYLQQTGNGSISAAPVWATIAASEITSGAALTKTDDTNVTMTLGGTPSTALLVAASMTLGWTGTLSIARGGTGQGTSGAAFAALSPMTTLGDTIYEDGTPTPVRLAGNITTTKKFLTQTGNGSVSAAPGWNTIVAGDVPTLNQNTTGSAATLTTARLLAGNSFNGSADVPFVNKFIVQGTTDAGLTGAQFLGALATGIVKNTTTTGVLSIATAGTDYEVPLTFSTGLTRTTNTITVNTSQNIATLSNLTTNGFVKTTGGTGALSIDTNTYITGNQTITLSGHVTGSGTTAITTSTASKMILQGTTDTTATAAQFLGALATGLVKNTTTTGVLSIATAGTDYQAPISLTTTGTSGAATFVSNTLNIPTPAATTITIAQTAHGFSVGNVVRLSGTSIYAKAQGDSAADAEVIGMVTTVVNANSFILTIDGYVTGLSGLTANTTYFLDPATAGGITATEPTTVGQVRVPLFVADTTTSGYFHKYEGQIINVAGAATFVSTQYIGTATKTVTNTAAETSALATSSIGTLTLPANFFSVGTTIRLIARGTYQTPTVPSNVVVKVKLGSTVLATVTVAGTVVATSSTTNVLQGEVVITCRTTGASGTLAIEGYMDFETALSGIPIYASEKLSSAASTVTVDTTSSQLLDITETWAAAQVGQGTTISITTLEQLF